MAKRPKLNAGSSVSYDSDFTNAASRAYVSDAIKANALPTRRFGTVRWYNGRRTLGYVIPDGGGTDLFIPAKGAPNGSQVPPQPGGLFHGTRVSFEPLSIATGSSGSRANNGSTADTVCSNVLPLPGQIGLSCGVETIAGAKEINDDRICAADLYELGFLAGVFDGHRGFDCSEYVSQQIPTAVMDAYRARVKKIRSVASLSVSSEVNLILNSIKDAFEITDKAWLQHAKKKELSGGSTGLVVLVSHGFEAPDDTSSSPRASTVATACGGVAKLFVAWCGDSRAVLCRGRKGIRLSEDHKPDTRAERTRIKAAGGHVMQDAWGTWRVGGRDESDMLNELNRRRKPSDEPSRWLLSTSRSFGDVELKVPDPLVISEPDIRVVDLVPEDWSIILACDGVFDVLSDQEVADTMFLHQADPIQAARAVVQRAFEKGSKDNLTAVTMRLGWSQPPSAIEASAVGLEQASTGLDMFG